MTPDQIVTIITALPGVAILIWIIIRQDARIDLLLKQQAELIERFIPPDAKSTSDAPNGT